LNIHLNPLNFEYTFESIEPKKYIIRVVEDDNENGKWDSGNYLEKRKPEKIHTKTVTEMRPDWDTEVAFSIKEKPQENPNVVTGHVLITTLGG